MDSKRNLGWNEKNLTRFQVRKLLGNPNTIKGDLNPNIDQVYHYHGDLDADGKEEHAKVKFYCDRVVFLNHHFDGLNSYDFFNDYKK